MTKRLGILGGTFNPIHFGHLAAAEDVCDRLRLDRILFIPAFLPPHKQEDMPSAADRLEMVRLAISGNPRFSLSDLEIRRGGMSYTIDTIEELRSMHPGADIHFITGLDSFLDIRTWKDWQRLLGSCTFVVLSRESSRFRDLMMLDFLQPREQDLIDLDEKKTVQAELGNGDIRIILERIPFYEISSTDIRNRRKAGKSIKYLLPESVEGYIIEKKFYG